MALLSGDVALAWGLAAVAATATCYRVWRGGTTLNDHVVALFVAANIAVYPVVYTLAAWAGPPWTVLGGVLWLGPAAIYGLFHALDQRRDPGLFWTAAGRLAQPAMAFALWSGLFLLAGGLAALVAHLLGAWPPASPTPWLFALLLPPAVLTALGTYWTYARHGTVRRNAVTLGRGGPVLRVVHLSDIHASPVMLRRDIRAMVDRAAALDPHLVVATGDFIMPFSEEEHGYLVEELARFPVPVLGCLGNHDLPVASRLVDEFARAGMKLLVDETVTLEVDGRLVEVAGVGFHWRHARDKLLAALSTMPPAPAHARLLLAHDPRLFAWLPAGRFHLVLSGHTHGGQVGTDMFGLPWSVLRPLGVFDQGRFDGPQGSLWVHRGNWHTGLPPRMGIAAEVVVHEIATAEGPPAINPAG